MIAPPPCGILLVMRFALFALLLALGLGCASTKPQAIQDAVGGNLNDWQLLEQKMLEYVPADADPIDFSQYGGAGAEEALYRPRDGWRIIIRSAQLRAASLVAYSKNETFDHDAGFQALVLPAIIQAKKNLPKSDDE